MMHIRSCAAGDMGRLVRLAESAWDASYAPDPHWPEHWRRARRRNFIDDIADCAPDVRVVCVDGDPIGWASWQAAAQMIRAIWVRPAFQGRGIGTGVIETVEQAIRAAGHTVTRVQITADRTRVLSLFQRSGYRIVGTQTWPSGDRTYSLHTLEKSALDLP
jgi:GNAT superfamily N-acetyltransferase